MKINTVVLVSTYCTHEFCNRNLLLERPAVHLLMGFACEKDASVLTFAVNFCNFLVVCTMPGFDDLFQLQAGTRLVVMTLVV